VSALPPVMDLRAHATSFHSGVYLFYLEAVRLDYVAAVVVDIQALAVLVVAIGVDQDS
jgi:hypothetical protein